MLDPESIRAIGDRFSMFGLEDGSGGISGNASDFKGECVLASDTSSLSARRSGDGLSGGGAAGNLKFCEKEPDGFLVPLRKAGVFGVVAALEVLRADREGRDSWKGSCMVGGEPPPTRGE